MNQLARWCLKKSVRQSIAALSAASGGVRSVVAPPQGPRIRVLTYHRFGDLRRDPFCVDASTFAAQMEWLAREELAVSLDDVHAFLRGARDLPTDAVLVTIDDACPSVHGRALPILRRFGIPSVLFVPAGELRDVPGADDDGPDGRMTRDQLLELARAGVTIGSHAWTHRSLGRLSTDEARDELVRSRSALEQLIDAPVTAFAYPFGTRADFNPSTRALLASAGYACAFTSQHGAIVPGTDPLTLPRIKVEGGEGLWMFRRLTHGGLDGWRWIDRTLWPLQAARG
jgi:peptidoglycan/xylan/chitin deacetylase (PgdA/CDA1 family)